MQVSRPINKTDAVQKILKVYIVHNGEKGKRKRKRARKYSRKNKLWT